MEDDWDLQAVVRSCSAATSSSSTTPPSPPPLQPPPQQPTTTIRTTYATSNLDSFSTTFQPQQTQGNNLICFQDLIEQREDKDIEVQELHDLCKPFFFQTSKSQHVSQQNVPVSPLSVLGCFQDPSSQQQQRPQPQQNHHHQQLLIQRHIDESRQQTQSLYVSRKRDSSNNTHNPRSKKRKNQVKKVCQIPAEGLSSDMWSWRKYGQKPIKGSPYPRGYYKCSTSKGCLARKQVERDRSNPNMLIVTYTGEHSHPMPTHRNSLAGSTRHKPATNSDDPNKPNTPSLDEEVEKMESSKDDIEEEDDDDNEFDILNMPLDEDFFVGLDVDFPNNFPAISRPKVDDVHKIEMN
ncbi:hypothetical protein Leryth_004118 [Lithospermum erythrorhizon]|nr:hypothetical protein Leryth_004118 [Lithospermum erythrorhizon]